MYANFLSRFHVYDFPKDSSCLSAALVHRLVARKDSCCELNAAVVRRDVINGISSTEELKSIISERITGQTLDDYLLSMSNVKTWRDENVFLCRSCVL